MAKQSKNRNNLELREPKLGSKPECIFEVYDNALIDTPIIGYIRRFQDSDRYYFITDKVILLNRHDAKQLWLLLCKLEVK